MHTLKLIGIGTGNPEHLTLQAIREMRTCDLILIPRKGEEKGELAALRDALNNVSSGVDRSNRMVSQMLALARAEALLPKIKEITRLDGKILRYP